MDLNLLDLNGYYEPGFLHLQINENADLSDIKVLQDAPANRKLFSTLLHEYIHFLQNITTTAGLFTAIHYIDILKEITNTVHASPDAVFNVPFVLANDFNAKANRKLQEIYRGDSDVINDTTYLGYIVETEQVSDKEGLVYTVSKYRVSFLDGEGGGERKRYFGVTCLKEYVAHEIQTKYYPETIHPDFPYTIAGLILDEELPVLSAKPMLKVAFCDACLMFTHPAQLFFNSIERFKKEGLAPNSCREVYETMWANLTFKRYGEKHTVAEFFKLINQIAKDQFADALKSEIFEPNKIWLEHLFNLAYELRMAVPDFMCHLIDEHGELSEDFKYVNKGLGWPFFTNNQWKGNFIPPDSLATLDIQSYQLLVFKEIIKVFNGSKSCGLFHFCNNSNGKVITNQHCTTAPWKRVHEEQLCPFAQFWKTWGLTDKTPVKR